MARNWDIESDPLSSETLRCIPPTVMYCYYDFINSFRGIAQPPKMKKAIPIDAYEYERVFQEALIHTRGWVYQERFLSSRVLYLGYEQLYWECNAVVGCEVHPKGMHWRSFSNRRESQLHRPRVRLPSNGINAGYPWNRVIEEYTCTRLTDENDRLIAIAGVAQLFASCLPDEYMAGLWKKGLLQYMLWHGKDPSAEKEDFARRRCGIGLQTLQTRPNATNVPSWSWASYPYAVKMISESSFDFGLNISYQQINYMPLAFLRSHRVTPTGLDPYGKIYPAELDLSCVIIQVKVPAESTSKVRVPVKYQYQPPYIQEHLLKRGAGSELMVDRVFDMSPPCFFAPLIYYGGKVYGLIIQRGLYGLRSLQRMDKNIYRRIGFFSFVHRSEHAPAPGKVLMKTIKMVVNQWLPQNGKDIPDECRRFEKRLVELVNRNQDWSTEERCEVYQGEWANITLI